ncbi:MAG: NfeD family protein [Butyrivibrio sp.]|nr:NfeD family protein [Butyrivibrio sp.]
MEILSTPVGIWLVIVVVMALIELATMGLITIWFAAGALVSMILAILGVGVPGQVVAFFVVSVLVLCSVRPLAAKHFNNKLKKTNLDAIIGKKLIAMCDIDNLKQSGKVQFEGSIWLARSSSDMIIIREGEEVRVVNVVGNKLIVEREVNN